MRYLVVVIFILFNCFVFAQSANKYPMLVQELNEAFKNDVLRGIKFDKNFSIDSFSNISFHGNGNSQFDSRLRTVLESTKDSITSGAYYVSIYWDLYSDMVYSIVVKQIREEGSFPNYDLINASPWYGYRNYIKTFKSDIISKSGSLDSLNLKKWYNNNWYKSVEVFIDKRGEVTYLSNQFVNILDSTKRIKWYPALYYARPRNSIRSFRCSYEDVATIDDKEFEWLNDVFVLDNKFQFELVRFEEYPSKIPYGKTVISFVLNPLTDKFENPFLHRGDIELGKELISWIEQYDFSDLRFYWENYPSANRVYFYIK